MNHRDKHLVSGARMLLGILIAVSILSTSPSVSAAVIERVVAVINDKPILMTELRQRARPILIDVQNRVPSGAQRAAAESEALRQMLMRMIDDQLEAQAAAKMKIRVDGDEVEKAIGRLARMQDMTVGELMAEVARSGMTPQEYRSEIRRQILEGKLLDTRVRGQVRVTESDMRAMFDRLTMDERRVLGYSLQWIVLRMPVDASVADKAERRELAEKVVEEARSGVDFAELARRYSDDSLTRSEGGNLGARRPGELEPAIERIAFSLEIGEVSSPFRYADALIVLRVVARDPSRLGSFDKARDQLANRVYSEKLEVARRRWLDNLKRSVHIDIRL